MGVKYSVNNDYFKKWSPTMSYILGYLYADGSLEYSPQIRGKYIRATSIDKELIITIKQALESSHKITILKNPESNPGQKRYFIRIGSHTLFDDLANLGMTPNKSKSMLFPQVPRQMLSTFIRGYFDGDGCVYIEYGKGIHDQKILKRLTTIFTSGSKKFLDTLSMHLSSEAGLTKKIPYTGGRAYRLRYMTQDSVKLFEYLYASCENSPYLSRKFSKFKNYFRKRPSRATPRIKQILTIKN